MRKIKLWIRLLKIKVVGLKVQFLHWRYKPKAVIPYRGLQLWFSLRCSRPKIFNEVLVFPFQWYRDSLLTLLSNQDVIILVRKAIEARIVKKKK